MAFGGSPLNPTFRAAGGPLAVLHVVLNRGLLEEELAGTRRRPAIRLAGLLVLAVIAVPATLAAGTVPVSSRLSQGTS